MSWDSALRAALMLSIAVVGWRMLSRVLARAPWRGGSEFARAVAAHPPETGARPAELAELERVVRFGRSRAGDLHNRLRPTLRALATDRLQHGYGVDLDRDAEAARRLLGDQAYALLRPDRREPTERWAPGITRRDLTDVIDRLEAL